MANFREISVAERVNFFGREQKLGPWNLLISDIYSEGAKMEWMDVVRTVQRVFSDTQYGLVRGMNRASHGGVMLCYDAVSYAINLFLGELDNYEIKAGSVGYRTGKESLYRQAVLVVKGSSGSILVDVGAYMHEGKLIEKVPYTKIPVVVAKGKKELRKGMEIAYGNLFRCKTRITEIVV